MKSIFASQKMVIRDLIFMLAVVGMAQYIISNDLSCVDYIWS